MEFPAELLLLLTLTTTPTRRPVAAAMPSTSPLWPSPPESARREGGPWFGPEDTVKVCSWVPGPEEGIAESHTGPDLGPGKSLTP